MWPIFQPTGGMMQGMADRTGALSALLISLVVVVILAVGRLVFAAAHSQH